VPAHIYRIPLFYAGWGGNRNWQNEAHESSWRGRSRSSGLFLLSWLVGGKLMTDPQDGVVMCAQPSKSNHLSSGHNWCLLPLYILLWRSSPWAAWREVERGIIFCSRSERHTSCFLLLAKLLFAFYLHISLCFPLHTIFFSFLSML
jgi:hypothetical protein